MRLAVCMFGDHPVSGLCRRELLASTAGFLFSTGAARSGVIERVLPWQPGANAPPKPVRPGPWQFFTLDEARVLEAIVDRLIPPDPETPGGKDAGCAVFIDRQLAGPYGREEGLYRGGPFQHGTKQQGDQATRTVAERYRVALAGLERHCRGSQGGKSFEELTDEQKDSVLSDLEAGKLTLPGLDAKAFFAVLLKDTQEGFFADPIYGGNRDMVAWKMIGFPGAHYDYRDWVERHNERVTLPPVSIMGSRDWMPRKT